MKSIKERIKKLLEVLFSSTPQLFKRRVRCWINHRSFSRRKKDVEKRRVEIILLEATKEIAKKEKYEKKEEELHKANNKTTKKERIDGMEGVNST